MNGKKARALRRLAGPNRQFYRRLKRIYMEGK